MNIKQKQAAFNMMKNGSPQAQNGMALIVVIVVLFVLTLLGVASTDSSNLQAVMVRNNQFRLEAFNTSLSEIEDQLDYYVTEEGKKPLFSVIDLGTEAKASTKDGSTIPSFTIRTNNVLFNKELALSKSSGCAIVLNSLGGISGKKCSLMQLDIDSVYVDTNIGSDQAQQFSFISY